MSVWVGCLKVFIAIFIQYGGLSQQVDKRIINVTQNLLVEGIRNINKCKEPYVYM